MTIEWDGLCYNSMTMQQIVDQYNLYKEGLLEKYQIKRLMPAIRSGVARHILDPDFVDKNMEFNFTKCESFCGLPHVDMSIFEKNIWHNFQSDDHYFINHEEKEILYAWQIESSRRHVFLKAPHDLTVILNMSLSINVTSMGTPYFRIRQEIMGCTHYLLVDFDDFPYKEEGKIWQMASAKI